MFAALAKHGERDIKSGDRESASAEKNPWWACLWSTSAGLWRSSARSRRELPRNRKIGSGSPMMVSRIGRGGCNAAQERYGDYLQESCSISLEEWRRQPVTERAAKLLGWVVEQQQ